MIRLYIFVVATVFVALWIRDTVVVHVVVYIYISEFDL